MHPEIHYDPPHNRYALQKMLARLQVQLQTHFDLPVESFHCSYHDWPSSAVISNWNPEARIMLPFDFYYLATVKKRTLLERFRVTEDHQLMLFSINPGFFGSLWGRKEVCCHITVPNIAEIVKTELLWYADQTEATHINCTGLPGSKSHFASIFQP